LRQGWYFEKIEFSNFSHLVNSADAVNGDSMLNPNDREWKHLENLLIDPAANIFTRNAHLKWPDLLAHKPEKTELEYFSLMFPTHSLRTMLHHTNFELLRRNKPELSHGEYFVALGGRLMMVCESRRGPLEEYWNTGCEEGSVYTGADFGTRLGMSRHRFQDIFSCLSFSGRHGTHAVDDVRGSTSM
jgi:hypothetical protein